MSIDELFAGMKATIDKYLESLDDITPLPSNLVSPATLPIRDIEYVSHVKFVGIAHLSQRSIHDTVQAIEDTAPVGVCFELCPYRYEDLKRAQEALSPHSASPETSEVVTAVDHLERRNTDVWLVDMNQEEIAARVLAFATLEEARAWKRIQHHLISREAMGLRLWEEGLTDEAMAVFQGDVGLMKEAFPTLWRVLIVERNVFMACSILSVVSHYLDSGLKEFTVVAVVGAAHVAGIQELLQHPTDALKALEGLGIGFRKPHRILKG